MNSPLTTSVVGTSTAAPPPNAPLTPAMATTITRPAAKAMILRLLPRHMSLHRDSRLQTGRDNHFVIAHRTERNRTRPRTPSVEHAHRICVVLTDDCVARHNDDVVFALELDVDSRRQIGHQ